MISGDYMDNDRIWKKRSSHKSKIYKGKTLTVKELNERIDKGIAEGMKKVNMYLYGNEKGEEKDDSE